MQKIKAELESQKQRLEYIDRAGLYLMQKLEPADAVEIDRDLDKFHDLLNSVLNQLVDHGQALSQAMRGKVGLMVCLTAVFVMLRSCA